MNLILPLLAGLLIAPTLQARQEFTSGRERASLIELYTSEGCSSCPPAEQWLNKLRDDPGLWKTTVPVAFHVTYWDKLGWKDTFARKSFTERQYAYSHLWRSESVYTPCFVRNGMEWKPGGGGDAVPEVAGKLTAVWGEKGRLEVGFEGTGSTEESLQVWAALLVSDVDSAVARGENAGRKLRHNFTAVQVVNAPLGRANDGSHFSTQLTLPKTDPAPAGRWAIAVWVTRAGSLGPVIQATGGWLSGPVE